MKKVYLVFLFMLLGINTARADFNDGVVAYLMGDYEKAYNTMVSLAKTDEKDGLAQYYLGMMYLKGQGVAQDYEEAGVARPARHHPQVVRAQRGEAEPRRQGRPEEEDQLPRQGEHRPRQRVPPLEPPAGEHVRAGKAQGRAQGEDGRRVQGQFNLEWKDR